MTETKAVARKSIAVTAILLLVAFRDHQLAPRLNWLYHKGIPPLRTSLYNAAVWSWFTARPATWRGVCKGYNATKYGVSVAYRWTAPKVHYCQIGSRCWLAVALRFTASCIDPTTVPAKAPGKPAKASKQVKKALTLTAKKKPARKAPKPLETQVA